MNERAIFLEALDRDDPLQRATFVDAACAGDDALRQRVTALLKSHAEAGPFLGKLAPQRLAEELAIPPTDCETQGGTSVNDTAGDDLDFLAPSDRPDALGRLAHYEILEVIGRGGMGIVLRAFDEKLHRVVAIKVMAAQLATNAAARRRFSREAQAQAAVSHDHIVTIHAVEEAAGLPYLVMQCVAGMSLQERLDRDGPLEIHEILRIGMQTASGLAAAHAQGLIHRDIKPANILLENGVERVKVTDFGLARAATDASLTQSGVVAGTPHYMSPEQARGDAVDQRTDLFSLGSVLYAMCTGRTPFRASGSIAVLKRVCEETPRPIHDTNVAIPDWLLAIIDKLHAKDPAKRYQSASEVADLLGRHLAHVQQPSVASLPPVSLASPQREKASGGRSRRRWAVAAAVLLLVLGSLSFTEATGVTNLSGTVIRILTPDGTLIVETGDRAVKVTVEGDGGLVITADGLDEIRLRPGSYKIHADRDGARVPLERELVSIAKGGREVVRVKLEGLTVQAAVKPEKGAFVPLVAGKGSLDTLDPAQIPPDERFNFQPKELVQVLGEHRGRQWETVTCVAYSPDGKLAASSGYDGYIYVWDAERLQLRAMLEGHGRGRNTWSVVFLLDNRRLLSAGDDNLVHLWDVEAHRELCRFEGHTGPVGSVAVSHDGRRVLTGAADRLLRLWDVETGEEIRRFEGHTDGIPSVAFSPDDTQALSGSDDKTMRLWDVATGELIRRFVGHAENVRMVRYLPDGRRAVSCSHDKTVRLWDLQTGDELQRFEGHTSQVFSVDISPDGRRAVSSGHDRSIRLWDVETAQPLRPITTNHHAPLSAVAFSRDGRRVLSGGWDCVLRLWDRESGADLSPPLVDPVGGAGEIARVAFSADGSRVLACISHSDVARLFDVASARQLHLLKMTTSNNVALFSTDGREALCAGERGLSVWSVETGQELRRFEGAANVSSIALSQDGRLVLTGDYTGPNGSLQVWQYGTGHELQRLRGHTGAVQSVALSADARRALSGGMDKIVRLWELDSGSVLHQWQQSNTVWSVALSPDGRYAAASDNDAFVRLWDLSARLPTPRPLPRRHTRHVRAIAFSPDGRALASAGGDGRIVIWDTATGTSLREIRLPGSVMGLSYAPDGRHLAAANSNATLYILRLAAPENTATDN